jgi:Fur family transcriptional regulator, iron response regulator
MNTWQLKVHGTGHDTRVRLVHDSGLCRGWTGDLACRLCRHLDLGSGEHPCPKQQAWRLFLTAHAIEQALAEMRMGPQEVRQALLDHGLAPTPTRTAIAALLLPYKRHVTAESLACELNLGGPKCSLARVRLTLREFVEWDLLRAIDVGGGVVFYDTVISPHAHVYNADTGELTDLSPEQAWITGLPELPGDVRLDDIQLLFRVCSRPRSSPDL